MRPAIATILNAMRADTIPAASAGRWTVQHSTLKKRHTDPKGDVIPPGRYTWLFCQTLATALEHNRGECVMNTTPAELRKHLQFILKARGRVLVTGLGLGCVVRGLLAHGQCDSIDVIERSPDVIHLCGASVADPRVRIRCTDALDFARHTQERWDFAWSDLWSDPERDEPHLQLIHMELMALLREKVGLQGAWAFPRRHARGLPEFRLGVGR